MTSRKLVDTPRPMLWFAVDPPNLVSLAGLVSAVLGIYFAIRGVFPAAMIGLVWAVVFDWLDGRVARNMPSRTDEQREYGAQLDSLIDVVSFGVAPAVVLLSVGNYSPWFLPGAVVVFAAAVVRLAYFNVFGLVDGSTYRGLALDNNVIVLVALFAFQRVLGAPTFALVVYVTLMALAALNVSSIKTPKFGGAWYYALLGFAVCSSGFFGWQLFIAVR
jgi:CDP-diacylglycerol---serine O-phosphatidyltransferase